MTLPLPERWYIENWKWWNMTLDQELNDPMKYSLIYISGPFKEIVFFYTYIIFYIYIGHFDWLTRLRLLEGRITLSTG